MVPGDPRYYLNLQSELFLALELNLWPGEDEPADLSEGGCRTWPSVCLHTPHVHLCPDGTLSSAAPCQAPVRREAFRLGALACRSCPRHNVAWLGSQDNAVSSTSESFCTQRIRSFSKGSQETPMLIWWCLWGLEQACNLKDVPSELSDFFLQDGWDWGHSHESFQERTPARTASCYRDTTKSAITRDAGSVGKWFSPPKWHPGRGPPSTDWISSWLNNGKSCFFPTATLLTWTVINFQAFLMKSPTVLKKSQFENVLLE